MKRYDWEGEITEKERDKIIEILAEYTDDPDSLTDQIFEILQLEEY